MNTLARLYRNEDGDDVRHEEQKWCLVVDSGGSDTTFCTGEVFAFGEGGAAAKVKTVERGGVTCPLCLEKIKTIKAVKL